MPEVKYRSDNKGTTQKVATKFGNELTGKTATKVHPTGSQAQIGAQPMQKSPDIWQSFTLSAVSTHETDWVG